MATDEAYDVALSFAGEQRQYVDAVASDLMDRGVKVFYDNYEQVALWGKDLYSHLDWVYRKAARFCVVFVSNDYAEKVWTNHERRSAQARAIQENSEYLLPVRVDSTELPGLPPTVGYIDLSGVSPQQLTQMVVEKIGPPRAEPAFPDKVDRLWEALGLKGSTKEAREAKRDAEQIARSFYSDLQRMTEDERRVVASVLAFGCPGELPEGVHLSLNLLSRVTGMPRAQLLEHLGAVGSLNVRTILREPVHQPAEGEVVSDDQDVFLRYWSAAVPASPEATRVAYEAVGAAGEGFCADHCVDVVTYLDFRRLSKAYKGPLAIEQQHAHEGREGRAP